MVSLFLAKQILKNKLFYKLWSVNKTNKYYNFRRSLCKTIIKSSPKVLTLRNEDGFLITCDVNRDHGNARNIFINGNYEAGTCEAIKVLLPSGGTFVDAGGHLGHMSMVAAKKVGAQGKVVSIECNPQMLPLLKQNIRQNKFDNIEICEKAISHSEGSCHFMLHPTNAGSCRIVTEDEKDDLKMLVKDANNRKRFDFSSEDLSKVIDVNISESDLKFIEIKTQTFEEILKDHKLSKIDLLKVDIEGAEMMLFENSGAYLKGENAPVVVCECSRVLKKDPEKKEVVYVSEIWSFFQKQDWKAFKLKNGKNSRQIEFEEVATEDQIPKGNENFYFFPPGKNPSKFTFNSGS